MADSESKDIRAIEAEAAVHLIRAGREFLAASKSMIEGMDALLELLETRLASGAKPATPIQAIPIRRDVQRGR
jgi:hypothetical protein